MAKGMNQEMRFKQKLDEVMVVCNETKAANALLHRGLVTTEQRLHQTWQTLNILIRVAQKKFQLTKEELEQLFNEESAILMAESKAQIDSNIAAARAAASAKAVESPTGTSSEGLPSVQEIKDGNPNQDSSRRGSVSSP